ncbi:MAG: CoA transferase [Chloroflexi bacterium]|nr:CoA transferase [Chloroflexota bacterium]
MTGVAPHRQANTDGQDAMVDSRDIFKGLKVVDFSWVGVGPMAAQVFALYGAEVIRVESASRLDTFRNGQPLAPGTGPDRSAYWANVNRDKLGMTLNLRHPGAPDVVRRLVEHADVVTESFAPGFMHEIGMDYESLRKLNPKMIMISMSMEGQGGPHLGYKGFGLVLQATAGITGLTGWPNRPPVGTGVAYTDWFATHLAASAVICALEHRDRTGEGQYIDLSQLESTIWGLDDAIVRYSATGEVMTANGNRNERAVPHGVFRCAGEDRWCAISVLEDAQWDRLRTVMGYPAWARDPAFATFDGRQAREDEIEAGIAAWTAPLVAGEVAERLQAAGVPAYPVNDARDVQSDPQLAARGHFWQIEHPVIGPMTWDAPAYRLSGTPAYPQAPAPKLGQHNEYVYRDLLGYSEQEFVELMVQRVAE